MNVHVKALICTAAMLMPVAAYAQEFTWNAANAYPASEYQSAAMQMFADRLREETDGALDITVHHGGSLFANPVVLESTRNGLVEMGSELMQNLGREDPLWELDGIPFLVTSYDEAQVLWDLTREPLTEKLAESGVRLLFGIAWPGQGFFFDREVNSLADIEGINMRSYNPATSRLAELMGAVPTTVQITELQQAFATGLVNSFNTAPTSGVIYKSWEYTDQYLKTDAWIPKHMTFVREDAFAALPEEMQVTVLKVAAEVEAWGWQQARDASEAAEATLAENGMEVTRPDETFTAELAGIGDTMVDEFLERAGEEGAAIVEQLREQIAK